jgi:hypothetical protein
MTMTLRKTMQALAVGAALAGATLAAQAQEVVLKFHHI